ncbi:DUF2059 domain-containing protein [Salegentibacter chungangensis]|uniref:DUF2059 domain-containing protein n=1 Tax=Salegentibacter chungangensis TaxID=1335724 RepID=A0ABW3NRA8_9FLAO
MKKILLSLAIILSITSVAQAQSQNTYDAALKEMFELNGSEEAYKTVIREMVKMQKEQYSNISEEIWDDVEKEFLKTSLDDLVQMLSPVYKKYMSQSDLEEITAFYRTPAGEKLAKNTPMILQESMQVGREWGRQLGEDFEKNLREKGLLN